MACACKFGMAGLGQDGGDGSGDIYGPFLPPLDTTGDYTPPYPITPTFPTPSPSSSINWNAILGMWTQAGTQIAKAQAGALPSYQSIGPYGSTTMFGSPGGNMAIPGLPGVGGGIGLGTILIGGIALVVVMGMMGRR